jgi:hypothetical protein
MPVSSPIILAIRQLRQPHLKESLLHTALELAYAANVYGVITDRSLIYLAVKCHCCKQTIINHIKKLIELKILSKTVLWIKGNYCEVNTYRFLIPWQKRPAQMDNSQNSGRKLPYPQNREKKGSLREDLEKQRKGLRFYTPGSEQWEITCQEIVRLEGLLGVAERAEKDSQPHGLMQVAVTSNF